MSHISLSDRELATVLASLRIVQDGNRDVLEAMDHFAEHAPLTDGEIDVLCERLNCAPAARVVVVVEGGNVTDVVANVPVRFRCIDYDVDGVDEVIDVPQGDGSLQEAYRANEADATVDPEFVAAIDEAKERCGDDEDENEDDGCPFGDPDCLGNNGDCHDACQRTY